MCHRGGLTEPSIGTRLHDLPADVLHAIISGNDVAKLASAHPALRRALGTLPSLQPSLVLEVTLDRGGARTRRETAAGRSHRRRRDDFGAFRAAYPHLVIDALTVRVALPAGLLRRRRRLAAPVDWLPLRSLKQLCVETSNIGNGCTEVSASALGQHAMATILIDMHSGQILVRCPHSEQQSNCCGVCSQELLCTCVGQLLQGCPMLTQLTADIGCYNGFSLEDCAARFVACVRNAQQGHGMAQALRRLEVVSRCPVTLWRIWCADVSPCCGARTNAA